MNWRSVVALTCIVTTAVVWLALISVGGQGTSSPIGRSATWTHPRTPWGHPDLQGIWEPDLTSTPMERPQEFAGREFLTEQEVAEKAKREARMAQGASNEELQGPVRPGSIAHALNYAKGIDGQEYNRFWTDQGARNTSPTWGRTSLIIDPPDGRMPPFTRKQLQRWEARLDARRHRGQGDSWMDRYLTERCMFGAHDRFTAGGAGSAGRPAKKFVQTPDYVIIVYTTTNAMETLVVPLDGRPRLAPHMRQWQGDARGRWEGTTLVIETTNFVDRQDGGPIMPVQSGLRMGAHNYPGSGEQLRIVERFTRVGKGRMEYQYTVDDPATFVKPYTVLRPMSKADNSFQLFEPACHEGNYGLPNSLSAARADEAWAMQAQMDEDSPRRIELQAEWDKLKQWEASQGRR